MNDNAKSVLPYYISGPYADETYSVCETATGRVLRKFRGPADLLQAQQYDSGEARGVELKRMVAMDSESRAMFIARLENAKNNGEPSMTIDNVLALLNDCDYLASRANTRAEIVEVAECGANGSQGCSIKPCGPKGALQCEFCGAPPGQAGAVREQACELNAGFVKQLADVMATTFAAREIPTGALYRGIAYSQYQRSRETLFNAIDALAEMKKEQP